MALSPEGRSKILVVDDVRAQRLAIEATLSDLGEDVVSVASGAEALRFLLDHDAAVILLDVNMPGMDGFETASLVRTRPRSRHTPIIFLTAHADEMAAARAYSLGAVDYIFNPFPPEVLRAKVRVFVELSKMHARVTREAEQRIALSREQAARAAAEDESRRLRVLAEASGILTRSLDPATLVADLLALFVPLMADIAAIGLIDATGRGTETSWVVADGRCRVSRDPIAGDGELALGHHLKRVMAGGTPETLRGGDGGAVTAGAVVPLVARGRTFGALALGFVASGRQYHDADVHLIHDIAGRAAIALDNSQLHQEIQQRDRQKDEFLAMLSHELRNPLSAIATAVGLLDVGGVPEDSAARARGVIRRQTAHLSRMVDDLLDVARLTAGQIALASGPVNLADVVTRAVEALRVAGRLDAHHVGVQTEPLTVEADFARMEQVVTNLLVNAVKYTDPGGRIDVDVRGANGEAVITVRDTGIGIAADMLPRLFDLFAQGRQALDRAQGGLGIGLTLVRRLVEMQGGRVQAASDGVGRGSVFTVRLPLAATPSERGPDAIVPSPAVTSQRILVVEDNEDAREMLRVLLQLAGHEVYEASDGLQALRIAARVRPDVALIDVGLPGLDGLEVASRLRAAVDGDRALLVAVTGYGQLDDRRRALQAGFDLHLTKPIDPQRLNEALALAARRCGQSGSVKARGT